MYKRFVKKSGLQRRVGETAEEFARRVIANRSLPTDKVNAVTVAYLDARYGTGADNAVNRLKAAVAAIT